MTPTLWRVGIVNASTKSAELAGWRLHRREGRELPRQKGAVRMKKLSIARPGERPSFPTQARRFLDHIDPYHLRFRHPGLAVRIYGLGLGASPP
jgi:hypothetical protein